MRPWTKSSQALLRKRVCTAHCVAGLTSLLSHFSADQHVWSPTLVLVAGLELGAVWVAHLGDLNEERQEVCKNTNKPSMGNEMHLLTSPSGGALYGGTSRKFCITCISQPGAPKPPTLDPRRTTPQPQGFWCWCTIPAKMDASLRWLTHLFQVLHPHGQWNKQGHICILQG